MQVKVVTGLLYILVKKKHYILNYLNKNFEHPNLKITKIKVQKK